MRFHEFSKLLQSKEKHKSNEETAYRMEGNLCLSSIGHRVNIKKYIKNWKIKHLKEQISQSINQGANERKEQFSTE